MARTPLFGWLRKISRQYGHHQAHIFKETDTAFQQQALTRRDFLKTLAGATLAAGLLPITLQSSQAAEMLIPKNSASDMAPVCIVGGGLAGLTTAYRLMLQGIPSVIYEASSRLGGRVHTRQKFNHEGMFVELGGELIDTCHTEIITLCQELGIPLERFEPGDIGLQQALYCAQGKIRVEAEVLAAFKPLAEAIAEDLKRIFPDGTVQMPTYQQPFDAKWADDMTLAAYLDTVRDIEPWLINIIKAAYAGEYGLEPSEQSALNLLLLIGTDLQQGLRIFGESDEAMRVSGGNSRLISQLTGALQKKVSMYPRHQLIAIGQTDHQIQLVFSQGKAEPVMVNADHVVLALPLGALRAIPGIEQLNVSPVKKRLLMELGFGTNSKQMIGFKTRFWRQAATDIPANIGEIFTDWPSQCYWETSRLQEGKAGILTNFLGGQAGQEAQNTQWQKALKDLQTIYPNAAKQFDGSTAFFNWSKNPWAQGSYSCPKPGQYTSLIGAGLEPEWDNTLFFAGEHCSLNSMGFMNGAVDSGNQVALTIAKSLLQKAGQNLQPKTETTPTAEPSSTVEPPVVFPLAAPTSTETVSPTTPSEEVIPQPVPAFQ